MLNLQEVHFCHLQSQSNVYGLAKVTGLNGENIMIVSSLMGKVVSMEFQKKEPVSKEVPFTYIPGEIISIDAFNKHDGGGVVVGITFIKALRDGKNCQKFLNIYSDSENCLEHNLDNIADKCHNIELNFMPYQLSHLKIPCSGKIETVFLLSGSDNKIHLFKQDLNSLGFCEDSLEDFCPELVDICQCVTWMDFCYICGMDKRVTALGCQDGTVIVNMYNLKTHETIKALSIQHDGAIRSVCLFHLNTFVDCPVFVKQALEICHDEEIDNSAQSNLHLAVVSAIDPTVVYNNVLKVGFKDTVILSDSDVYDSPLCVTVADVDFDGQNELIIGTYGQELLIYKFTQQVTESNEQSADKNDCNKSLVDSYCWQLKWQKHFSNPIMAVDVVDVTGDGLKEIIVVSMKGLHILQHDLIAVADLCINRLHHMVQEYFKDDPFQALQKEIFTDNMNNANINKIDTSI